jgi:plastocyanin
MFAGLLYGAIATQGCDDNGGGGGNAGSGGGSAGSGGGSAGSGGGSAFMAVGQCTTEASYVTTPTTIDFGLIGTAYSYNPKCLKVPAGTQVRFMSTTSTLAAHPLSPSASIGTLPGNPITPTASGNDASFTFSSKGFWAYFCEIHGSDTGMNMAGVIWVD